MGRKKRHIVGKACLGCGKTDHLNEQTMKKCTQRANKKAKAEAAADRERGDAEELGEMHPESDAHADALDKGFEAASPPLGEERDEAINPQLAKAARKGKAAAAAAGREDDAEEVGDHDMDPEFDAHANAEFDDGREAASPLGEEGDEPINPQLVNAARTAAAAAPRSASGSTNWDIGQKEQPCLQSSRAPGECTSGCRPSRLRPRRRYPRSVPRSFRTKISRTRLRAWRV